MKGPVSDSRVIQQELLVLQQSSELFSELCVVLMAVTGSSMRGGSVKHLFFSPGNLERAILFAGILSAVYEFALFGSWCG